MSWIENNPMKSGLIVSIFIFLFGALYHSQNHVPNDWGAFLMWIPVYLILPLSVGFWGWGRRLKSPTH